MSHVIQPFLWETLDRIESQLLFIDIMYINFNLDALTTVYSGTEVTCVCFYLSHAHDILSLVCTT